MIDKKPLVDSIKDWLESSGRALELRVARDYGRHGASRVEQSFHYEDLETGKDREGDVRGHFTWMHDKIPCAITAVTECKSSRGKPWVAMLDQVRVDAAGTLEEWAAFAHGPFQGITQQLPALWAGREPFIDARVATHAVAVLGKEDDGANKPNAANDAIRQVMSTAAAERMRYVKAQGSEGRGLVILPVVVTSAPLFTCELNASNELELLPVQSFTVQASAKTVPNKRVYVLSEEAVPRFAQALTRLATLAGENARTR